MRTRLFLGLCCAAVALSIFAEVSYAQPRKRKFIEPTEQAPAAVKSTKPIDINRLARQKQQELLKNPDQILTLAIAQYQGENYAVAESLLVLYGSLSQNEPLMRREQAELMQIKTQVKLGRVSAAKAALAKARLEFSSETIRREADFDAAALEYQEGEFFSAAKKFMTVVGASWSPTDHDALARRAAMHLYTLANAFLQRSDLIELLQATENPHLSVLLLDAFLRRELASEHPAVDSLARVAQALETKHAAALSPAYRTMLASIQQCILLARS
ncbi:MAG: hypothetical protein ACK424_02935, partial [Candidatus Thermochlorobacter sp.]